VASGFKRDDVVHRLGGERMRPYLAAAEGHHKRALALYRWNMGVSAAFLELLSVVEVVVRNALAEHLIQWCRINGGYHDWLLHPDELPTPLDKLFASVLQGAYAKAEAAKTDRDARPGHPRSGSPLTSGDVLSQVTFGQWHGLFPWNDAQRIDPTTNAYRTQLWNEATKEAFHPATSGDQIHWLLFRLSYFRNRVAHHECVLDGNLKNRLDDVFLLLSLTDPSVHVWATSHNRVTQMLKERPK
jgi:hypothetical protein